jgi:hypothetical protein
MLEKDVQPEYLVRDSIKEIEEINKRLSPLYAERKAAGRLDSDTYSILRKWESQKNQKTIDVLIQRGDNPNISIGMNKFKDESLHTFSMNKITIRVNSPTTGFEYAIGSELTDLRRDKIAEDSLAAEKLLAKKQEEEEDPYYFLTRTVRELIKIRQARVSVVRGEEKRFSLEYLDELSSNVVHQRLVNQREELPPFLLDVRPKVINGDNAKDVTITVGSDIYHFFWGAQTFLKTG